MRSASCRVRRTPHAGSTRPRTERGTPHMPTFRSDDGTDIYYRCWGDTDQLPVVLHHGFVADSELDWVSSGVVASLTANGRTVVALDARGHGRSGKPHDPDRYGEARMARDLSLLIDELAVTAVDLVGYSMGAV